MKKEYVFLQFKKKKILKDLHLHEVKFPIRQSKKDEVIQKKEIILEALVEELILFLQDNSEYIGNYKEAFSALCYSAGMSAAKEGYFERGEYFFSAGLIYNPENISLKSNLALVLHMQGKKDEALKHYYELIHSPDVEIMPLIWIMAARLLAEKKMYKEAYTLLKACAYLNPQGTMFWDFYADMEKKAGKQKEKVSEKFEEEIEELLEEVKQEDEKMEVHFDDIFSLYADEKEDHSKLLKSFSKDLESFFDKKDKKAHKDKEKILDHVCSSCGKELKDKAKFCGECGAKVEKIIPEHKCSSCGKELKSKVKFCGECGTKVEQ